MNSMISRVTLPNGICNLGAIENVPNWARMMAGAPQTGQFPAEAQFKMDPDRPKDVKLADVLENMTSFLVVSERMKDFFVKENALKNNEVFEVGILNHKGRREQAKYFLIHQINRPKCVDEAQTVGTKSALTPDEYQALSKLVLDDSKIDPEVAIFRPAEYRKRIFFKRDLVDKIVKSGMTGLKFYEIESYT